MLEMLTDHDAGRAEALTGRLFNATQETLDILNVYIGDRLGLYRALAASGPVTPGELAARTRIDQRYAREWLEQQATTGILEVDDPTAPEEVRRFCLPRGHAASLIDPDSPFSIAMLGRALVACAQALPDLLEAYRTGGGVTWGRYGQDMIEGQGDFNRPWLAAKFGKEHLPQIADVHARLLADPPATVADFGCGVGWASIAIANAYPKVRVRGFDLDDGSITLARKNAAEAGVADRVAFEVSGMTGPSLAGTFDLAVAIEVIHDLARPVEALESMKRVLAPGGAAIILEPKGAEQFAPGDATERFLYGWSTILCLPVGRSEQPSAAIGTIVRPQTIRRYAREAGFRDVEILPIEMPFDRYYRLIP